MNRTRDVWYAREARIGDDLWRVTGVLSDEHPDGTAVEAAAGDRSWIWRAEPSDRGVVRIRLADESAPGAPPLWFVAVDEPRAPQPAISLVAFPTDDLPPGTVVSKYRFATMGVRNELQAGAVRWFRDLAVVHQVYVSPDWRRHHVGTVLLHAADAFHQANGWPGYLHSDGRRTDLGIKFLAGVQHPQRFAPVTSVEPPMDPAP